VQCLHRWQKVLRPGLVKGPWTQEECVGARGLRARARAAGASALVLITLPFPFLPRARSPHRACDLRFVQGRDDPQLPAAGHQQVVGDRRLHPGAHRQAV
jgi:hypothetical protein